MKKLLLLTLTLLILAVPISAFNAFSSLLVSHQKNLHVTTKRIEVAYYYNPKLRLFRCRNQLSPSNVLHMKMTTNDMDLEAEIKKMSAKDIREELESYGIPTRSFFEKSELVDALASARKEGKTPINVEGDTKTSKSSTTSARASDSISNHQDLIQKEIDKCKSMKVADLKKELESYGISTKSYFEKMDFVRAVAEARVDGVKKQTGGSKTGRQQQKEEPWDPSYRDVAVTKFTGDKKLMLGGTLIDVKAH